MQKPYKFKRFFVEIHVFSSKRRNFVVHKYSFLYPKFIRICPVTFVSQYANPISHKKGSGPFPFMTKREMAGAWWASKGTSDTKVRGRHFLYKNNVLITEIYISPNLSRHIGRDNQRPGVGSGRVNEITVRKVCNYGSAGRGKGADPYYVYYEGGACGGRWAECGGRWLGACSGPLREGAAACGWGSTPCAGEYTTCRHRAKPGPLRAASAARLCGHGGLDELPHRAMQSGHRPLRLHLYGNAVTNACAFLPILPRDLLNESAGESVERSDENMIDYSSSFAFVLCLVFLAQTPCLTSKEGQTIFNHPFYGMPVI